MPHLQILQTRKDFQPWNTNIKMNDQSKFHQEKSNMEEMEEIGSIEQG